jgi:hypothetical protein
MISPVSIPTRAELGHAIKLHLRTAELDRFSPWSEPDLVNM